MTMAVGKVELTYFVTETGGKGAAHVVLARLGASFRRERRTLWKALIGTVNVER
jgi:hypothetical protein